MSAQQQGQGALLQDTIAACFSGLAPRDFQHKVLFVTGRPVEPPVGFDDVWVCVSGEDDLADIALLSGESLESMSGVVLIADFDDGAQLRSLQPVVETFDVLGEQAPPLLSLHVRAGGPSSYCGELGTGLETLLDMGVDDVIVGEPQGLALVLAVRAALHKLHVQVEKFMADAEAAETQAAYVALLRGSIHRTLWEYLPRRVNLSIPVVDMSLTEGDMLPGYVLDRQLGRGMFGTVYGARPTKCSHATASSVAVKVMDKSQVAGLSDLRRISRGLETLELLSRPGWHHDGLVQTLGVFHSRTHLIVLMENGGPENLFQLLGQRDDPSSQQQPLQATLLDCLCNQLAAAVAHLHAGPHIAHRDIKPENVIVRQPDEDSIVAKLADFDLAAVQPPGRRCASKCGTFPFMAPEVALEREYDGFAADVWGLGVVMMEVICGRRILERTLDGTDASKQAGRPDQQAVTRLRDAFDNTGLAGLLLQQQPADQECASLVPRYGPVLDRAVLADAAKRFTAAQLCHAIEAEVKP